MSMATSLLSLSTMLLLLSMATKQVDAVNPVTAGAITTTPTYLHIGVRWTITGDDDLDSSMSLRFRVKSTSEWRSGAQAFRSYPTWQTCPDACENLGKNHWSASALFLEEGTTYEIELTLTDPDGGSSTQVVEATTRTYPQAASNGRQIYVSPGSGGGTGTSADPYLGVQDAIDASVPGDVINVAAGTYAAFTIPVSKSGNSTHYLVVRGPSSGDAAIIDGDGTDRGAVTLESSTGGPSYIIIEQLTVKNAYWGVDLQSTSNVVIQDCLITDVGFGIYNRRTDDLERYQTLARNVITGRTAWPGSGIPVERGVDLRGYGNVVWANRVSNFGDCISVQPGSGDSFANDVYQNDVQKCVDDCYELDFNRDNVRVYRNRGYNCRMGVSTQPVYGGPAYIFRNEFFNQEMNPWKPNNSPIGVLFVHNTAAKVGNGWTISSDSNPRNIYLRNNVIIGTDGYAFEILSVNGDPWGVRSLDFDAWGSERTSPRFKWDNVQYANLGALPDGVEDNGTDITLSDLQSATLPSDWNIAVDSSTQDLSLKNPDSFLGTSLANINDPFVDAGVTPTRGAFQKGKPLPTYGPAAASGGDGVDGSDGNGGGDGQASAIDAPLVDVLRIVYG